MKRSRLRRNQVHHLVQRHPWPTAAAVVVFCSLPTWLLNGWSAVSLGLGLTHHALMAVLAAAFLAATGWWSDAGLGGPSRWRNLHLAAIPLVAAVSMFRGIGEVSGAQFAPYAVLALLIAFEREAWFRGILFRVLVPKYGPRRTVGMTALLFGLVQAADIIGGAAPGVTLVKALCAALFGYVLGALRLRTRSIWPGAAVGTVFYLGTFLNRLQASGEFVPISQEQMGMQVLLALLVFVSARLWMRKADEQSAPEAGTVRAG